MYKGPNWRKAAVLLGALESSAENWKFKACLWKKRRKNFISFFTLWKKMSVAVKVVGSFRAKPKWLGKTTDIKRRCEKRLKHVAGFLYSEKEWGKEEEKEAKAGNEGFFSLRESGTVGKLIRDGHGLVVMPGCLLKNVMDDCVGVIIVSNFPNYYTGTITSESHLKSSKLTMKIPIIPL